MRIFVTGGAGFVGRYLVKSLVEKNHTITIFDDLSNSSKDKIQTLLDDGANFVKGNITDFNDISNSIKDFDVVIHLASKINVQASIKNPVLTKTVNVDGTKNLLEACKKNSITKIIAASSAAVYGNCTDATVHLSESTKTNPISPYGKSKLEMEQVIRSFSEKHGINSVILRFFNIYGIGQSPEYAGVITKFFQRIKENKPLEIFGDGLQTRDFISIQDAVDSIFYAISKISGKKGSIYNIATGKSISINDLASLMISLCSKDLKTIHHITKEGDIKFSQADISLAKSVLGYKAKIDLKDGIKNLMQTL